MRNFLDIDLINSLDLKQIIAEAIIRKNKRKKLTNGEIDQDQPLKNLIIAMLFETPSTRTRVSFDVAVRQLGGQSLIMNSEEMQLGRGESIADTSKVLSKYVDLIMLRCLSYESLEEMAKFSSVPVINERMITLEVKFSNELPIYLKDLLSTLPASRASIGKYVIGQRFMNYKDWRDPLTSIA